MRRHSMSMMSLAATPAPSRPSARTRTVGGTRTQISPVASTPAISVDPMPIIKQPYAPPVVEWESPPTTNMPGRR